MDSQLETVLQVAQDRLEMARDEEMAGKMDQWRGAEEREAAALRQNEQLRYDMSRLEERNQELEQSLVVSHEAHQTTLRILSNRERGAQVSSTNVARYGAQVSSTNVPRYAASTVRASNASRWQPAFSSQEALTAGKLNTVESIRAGLLQTELGCAHTQALAKNTATANRIKELEAQLAEKDAERYRRENSSTSGDTFHNPDPLASTAQPQGWATAFEQLDLNKDGVIDRSEFLAASRRRDSAAEIEVGIKAGRQRLLGMTAGLLKSRLPVAHTQLVTTIKNELDNQVMQEL